MAIFYWAVGTHKGKFTSGAATSYASALHQTTNAVRKYDKEGYKLSAYAIFDENMKVLLRREYPKEFYAAQGIKI